MMIKTAPSPSVAEIRGLSEREAQARRARGEGNNLRLATSRTYADIIRSNVFNIINNILFTIGAVMVLIGRIGDALTSVGVIILNVVVGVYQEIRAKRQLDQIALLTRPRVSVLRDGEEKSIDPAELVKGDIIIVAAGDQIMVDGVVRDGRIEVDESLLTGESDLIAKTDGDEVLSGSFCVTGKALYEATRVGADSFANKLTANARQFTIARTPLQSEINFLLRLLMLLALFIGFITLIAALLSGTPFMRQVQMAAVIAGLVPNGLFFMVVLAYAMGALRIARQGALVQQSNAVESLSNVTVLCLDKTGTLTANRIHYHDVYPVGMDKADLEHVLGDFAHSASASNKTGDAIAAGLGGTRQPAADEVPFSSARKWSALAFDSAQMRGAYVLGALEMLRDHLTIDQAAQDQITRWSDEGLRVLVFGHNDAVTSLHDGDGQPCLPPLRLLGVVSFSDELRPALRETLAGFNETGIQLKIISGDNPQTVAALARQAGFEGDLSYISGPELAEMSDAQLAQVAAEHTVFGRITPEQKEKLVDALRQQGHYVAMIGDGVNDVLSLKKANLGIAMESGSSAARAVADMILLKDSFGALPPAFTEGQRIVNGMKDIMRLFLTRVLYSALLIIATGMIGLGFPFIPKQNALLVFLSVGIPTIGLALWARPGPMPRRGLLAEIASFVLPASFSIFFFGLLVYFIAVVTGAIVVHDLDLTLTEIANFREYTGINYPLLDAEDFMLEVAFLTGQTALTAFTCFAGLLLVVFVEPPHPFFVGGDEYSGDIRPTLLAGLMLVIFLVVVAVPSLRSFFEMVEMPFLAYVGIGAVTGIWMLTLRWAWRQRWLERFLQVAD
jgi:cation-transporting ATPase E